MDTNNNTQQVLEHHLASFSENNIAELMKDYTEASSLCTPDGRLNGPDAIGAFFTEVFKLFPAGHTKLELKQMIVDDHKAYIAWNADSPVAEIPMGTDSFEINEGKIIWQTLAAHIVLK